MEVSWGNGGYVKDIRSVCRMVGWGEKSSRWERGGRGYLAIINSVPAGKWQQISRKLTVLNL